MVASMFAFSCEDVLLKRAASDLPVGLVVMVFCAVGTGLFAGLCAARGHSRLLNSSRIAESPLGFSSNL